MNMTEETGRIKASVDRLKLRTAARGINLIVLHCSATPQGRDVTVADIRRWHLERGFADIGYHFVVRLDGTVRGRPPCELHRRPLQGV